MRFPIRKGERYRGKFFVVDQDNEMLHLVDKNSVTLRTGTWEDAIDQALATGEFPEEALWAERRGFLRIPLSIQVKYTENLKKKHDSLTCNLSGGGLFIETRSPLPQGKETALEFQIPFSPDTIRARGSITWLGDRAVKRSCFPGMGIRFTEIREGDRLKVVEFVTRLSEERKRPAR